MPHQKTQIQSLESAFEGIVRSVPGMTIENIQSTSQSAVGDLVDIDKPEELHGFVAQFRYFKDVTVSGTVYNVEVDLLTGEYGGKTGKNRRHEPIQDIKARKARGADLVFEGAETIVVSGELPNNAGKDSVKYKIAGVERVQRRAFETAQDLLNRTIRSQ